MTMETIEAADALRVLRNAREAFTCHALNAELRVKRAALHGRTIDGGALAALVAVLGEAGAAAERWTAEADAAVVSP